MEAKNEFMQIYKENIHREGADKLLEWMERSDMFTAPRQHTVSSVLRGRAMPA